MENQSKPKKIFVAATRQNDGKTMVALGLFNAFKKRFSNLAYIKPVGQQYRWIQGEKIDKDAVLFQSTYKLPDRLRDMSPIAIPKGFTTNYINQGKQEVLVNQIHNAYQSLSRGKDFVLIEGTGHAGVGSVFDMSNANVADMLGSKVIIVSVGGIGRPIDEILLNKALFDEKGVEVLGVIVNKVMPEKYDRVKEMAIKGFKKHGLNVYGVIPTVNMLSRPSVQELMEDLEAELLYGEKEDLNNSVGKFIIGDGQPHSAVGAFSDKALLIVPGNRESMIVTALSSNLVEPRDVRNVTAMVFTDGIHPHHKIMDLIKASGVPVMLVNQDSFSVATKINKSIFKLRAEESDKIKQSQDLIEEYVDVDGICELL